MKLAVFIKGTTFHKGYGGLETQNKALCEGLARRNNEITVFSPQKELKQTELIENGVKYVFVDCEYKLGFGAGKNKNNWVNKSYEVFNEIHKNSPFDLVLGQSSAALGIIKHKKDLNIKVVSISHGTIVSEFNSTVRDLRHPKQIAQLVLDSVHVTRNFFGRQRAFIYGSDKLIAVSQYVKKAVIDETFVPDTFIEVINNGVDPTYFEKMSHTTSSKVRLIYIGRVIKIKGLFNLVYVLEKINNPNIQLDIVGSGEDFDDLKAYVETKNLTELVKLHGKLNYEDAISKLADSDIFVLPSLRVEGFPMVLAEAMFAELPIIASNIGGISDGIIDGQTGYLVKAGNLTQLKEKILALVEDEKLRKEMGHNGKIYAQNNFSIDVMLNKYEQVFKEVLNR